MSRVGCREAEQWGRGQRWENHVDAKKKAKTCLEGSGMEGLAAAESFVGGWGV